MIKGHQLTDKQISNFWSKVRKTNHCWIWIGARTANKYGCFRINKKTLRSNRVSWEINKGEIPNGLFVLHKCDNPACVRPSHLFLGTQSENVADMCRKGRNVSLSGKDHWTRFHKNRHKKGDDHWTHKNPEKLARGGNSGPRKHPENMKRGEESGRSKLNNRQVIEIRKKFSSGLITRAALARKYDMSWSAIDSVVKIQTWSHLKV